MTETLIDAQNTWMLWAALLICAAAGLAVERTRVGQRLSGAIVTMLLAALLSNLGVIPSGAPAYDAVWSYLVPLAIPLLLFSANLTRIFRESGKMLVGFLIAVSGTLLGVFTAAFTVDLDLPLEQIAAVFTATYTGGSMNFAATAQVVGLESGDLLAASVAADSLMSVVFLLALFLLASSAVVRQFLGARADALAGASAQAQSEPLQTGELLAALALAASLCAACFAIEGVLGVRGSGILLLTVATVLIATLLPGVTAKLRGAEMMGMVLMQIFFAAIGAAANIPAVLRTGPELFLFVFVMLGVHLAVLLAGGRLLRVKAEDLLVASNAAIGGPTTAAAMAAALRWKALVTPAILVGVLGYSIGTFAGVAVSRFFAGQ